MKKDQLKFAIMYALVGGFAFLAVAGFGLGLVNMGKASKASVAAVAKQVNPPSAAIVNTACQYVATQASSQGVILSACKLKPGSLKLDGDKATLTLNAESKTSKYKFVLKVMLSKGIYQGTGLKVTSVGALK